MLNARGVIGVPCARREPWVLHPSLKNVVGRRPDSYLSNELCVALTWFHATVFSQHLWYYANRCKLTSNPVGVLWGAVQSARVKTPDQRRANHCSCSVQTAKRGSKFLGKTCKGYRMGPRLLVQTVAGSSSSSLNDLQRSRTLLDGATPVRRHVIFVTLRRLWI
jgi:hypothetical protein